MSRRKHNIDQEATAAARFMDRRGPRGTRRSYITKTGKQFLFGIDKEMLRLDCIARDKSTCTKCGKYLTDRDADMHHIKHLGKGGDDTLANVTTRCKWGQCHKGEHFAPKWGPKNDVRLLVEGGELFKLAAGTPPKMTENQAQPGAPNPAKEKR